jgi:hypothetical protein
VNLRTKTRRNMCLLKKLKHLLIWNEGSTYFKFEFYSKNTQISHNTNAQSKTEKEPNTTAFEPKREHLRSVVFHWN